MERNAGAVPKIRHVSTATEAANKSNRQSVPRNKTVALSSLDKDQINARLRNCAKPIPAKVPINASNPLSAIDCLSKSPLEAPKAKRTANSRSRTLALASIRLARFAQAMSSTRDVIASNSHNEESYSSRRKLTPVDAG